LGIFYLEDEDVNDAPNDGNIPTDDEYGNMIIELSPDIDVETYNQYLNAEFVVNRDGEPVRARVSKRARTEAGSLHQGVTLWLPCIYSSTSSTV
jgi:hypothetical protein